jgi:CRISPR/Cas system CSM-associated protein Csm3 (group 7 of RAMP superfamily)
MFSRESQEPKPYDFVPLPDRVTREKPAGHDGFKRGLLSGVITGELVALTPVHVASGNIELTRSDRIPLVKAHFRTGGKIAIPGSSLKGVVRSIVEAITRSCVRVQSRATRDKLPRGFEACEVRGAEPRLCPACRIFGAMGYQGQVNFADAMLVAGDFGTMLVPSLFAPRTYSQFYLDRGRVKGRKFYFHGQPATGNVPIEVCNVGSRFSLRANFVNLSEAELGVLITAMGQAQPTFAIKLGGAKPACCGSVEVLVNSIEARDNIDAAIEFDSLSNIADTTRCLTAVESLLVHANLRQLHSILRLNGDRSCPSRGY